MNLSYAKSPTRVITLTGGTASTPFQNTDKYQFIEFSNPNNFFIFVNVDDVTGSSTLPTTTFANTCRPVAPFSTVVFRRPESGCFVSAISASGNNGDLFVTMTGGE